MLGSRGILCRHGPSRLETLFVWIDGGVAPRGVSRAATPSQLSRPSGELDNLVLPTLCGRVRSDASVGCSGHAQRHRFGPALRLRQSAVVKRHFPPAKSFIRAGVTTRGHRFQPRIPPGSLYSKPYNLYGGSPAILSPALLLLFASSL